MECSLCILSLLDPYGKGEPASVGYRERERVKEGVKEGKGMRVRKNEWVREEATRETEGGCGVG